jgi:L-methionine (R)-S-oxide reductase
LSDTITHTFHALNLSFKPYLPLQTSLFPPSPLLPSSACDGDTRSEIVVPLLLPSSTDPSSPPHQLGVLDIDSVCLSTFDEDDRAGLEKIAELVVRSCDWGDKFV